MYPFVDMNLITKDLENDAAEIAFPVPLAYYATTIMNSFLIRHTFHLSMIVDCGCSEKVVTSISSV